MLCCTPWTLLSTMLLHLVMLNNTATYCWQHCSWGAAQHRWSLFSSTGNRLSVFSPYLPCFMYNMFRFPAVAAKSVVSHHRLGWWLQGGVCRLSGASLLQVVSLAAVRVLSLLGQTSRTRPYTTRGLGRVHSQNKGMFDGVDGLETRYRNSIKLIIYVEPSFMQVCASQLSSAYCIFGQPANNNVWKRLLFNLTFGWLFKIVPIGYLGKNTIGTWRWRCTNLHKVQHRWVVLNFKRVSKPSTPLTMVWFSHFLGSWYLKYFDSIQCHFPPSFLNVLGRWPNVMATTKVFRCKHQHQFEQWGHYERMF